ncbi:hypothetical protein TrVE_jg7158 [Triparma verrucosa]|uniref:Myosin motor domain-containing protein n=1 Tax=Triparma verrucosa TaxID=1606542 RepID=A0A9W7KXT4_9STRA|nr:hypothetical protein TrVE_jg7158 [Triparma verrucosa]
MEVGTAVWLKDPSAPTGWKAGVIKTKSINKDKTASLTIVGHKIGGTSPRRSRLSPLKSPNSKAGWKHRVVVSTETESDVVKIQNNSADLTASDLTRLPLLHEPAILNSLQIRYNADEIYTSIGAVLIAVNPFKRLTLYSDETLRSYKAVGEQRRDDDTRLQPHIFQLTDDVYRNLIQSFEDSKVLDQSILISGESGAGKTWTSKIAMKYLAVLSRERDSSDRTDSGQVSMENQVLLSNPILESFGNARTQRNDNSSRFGKFINISFNDMGVLAGASIETYLLEKSRVISQTPGERNYHIFYQILSGSSKELLGSLGLSDMDADDFKILQNIGRRDGVKDYDTNIEMLEAFEHLGFSDELVFQIQTTVSAVMHLGNVEFAKGDQGGEGESSTVVENEAAMTACRLLGISFKTLEGAVCYKTIRVIKDVVQKPLNIERARKSLEALIKAIFANVFEVIVARVNASITLDDSATSSNKHGSISVLDIFGFESFEKNSFEQFCINFTNETLQQQYNRHIFLVEQEIYEKEGILWSFIEFPDNEDVLRTIDGRHPSILSLLDEQCIVPKASDGKLAKSLYRHLKDHEPFGATRLEQSNSQFSVRHYARKVVYDCARFVETNLDDIGNAEAVICASSMSLLSEDVAQVIASHRPTGHNNKASVSCGRKFSTALKSLRLRIEQTQPSFIRCIKPNDMLVPDNFDAINVVEQLRCAGVLSAVEVSRAGFSTRFSHEKFTDRYFMLAPKSTQVIAALVETVAHFMFQPTDEMSMIDFRKLHKLNPKLQLVGLQLGKSLVFMKRNAFECLEKIRAAVIHEASALVQARIRAFLTRKAFLRTVASIVKAQSIARVQLARKIAAVARAKIFVACYVQRVGRGFMGRQRVYRIIRMRLEKAASTKIQAVARMFIATNYFIDSITDIIIAQSVVRGYIVRCDPASFKESLIAAQMEVEREELIHRANMAKAQEIEAEKRAIEVLEFEAAAAVGKTPLFFAIEGGDWPRVNTIIASEPESLEERGQRNETPLHALCRVELQGDEKLSEITKDMKARAGVLTTMVEMRSELLKEKDLGNDTALHVAARHGASAPLVQLLLQAGSSALAVNALVQTPVHSAVIADADGNVKCLIEKCSRAASLCDVNRNNALALAILHQAGIESVTAILNGLDNLEGMLVLEQENNEGRTPLTIAIVAHASWDILEQMVIHKHAVLKASDVLIAIEKGLSIESLTLLLDNIASDEELKDAYTRNVLHVAIASKATHEIIELLIQRFPECSQEIDPLTNKSCVELGHQNNLADITLLLLLSNCEGAVFKTAITFIASKTSDSRVAVLEDYLQASTQEHRLKCAVMRTGPRNAKLVTVSTAMAKQAFKTSLRYLGRFELSAVPVARNEETGIEIFRACDYGVDGGDKVDVVLKFSKELGVVEDELYARKKLDSKYVNSIRDTFATSTGFVVSFPNCTTLEELLMANPPGSRVENRKAVKWLYAIAKALTSVHDSGIAHSELTTTNVGVTREGRWTLLSLGSSVRRAREAALQDQHTDFDTETQNADQLKAKLKKVISKAGVGPLPLLLSPPRKNFGSVKNRSPIRFAKFDPAESFSKDLEDLGKIGCRLFGVSEDEARESTMTSKISKKTRKAPVALLGKLLRAEVPASEVLTDDFFINHKRNKARPGSKIQRTGTQDTALSSKDSMAEEEEENEEPINGFEANFGQLASF